MGLRTAVSQSWVLTAMATGIGLWCAYIAVQTFAASENIWAFTEETASYVGTNAVGGLAGVAVLVGIVALLFVFAGELGESEPAPQAWPPEE